MSVNHKRLRALSIAGAAVAAAALMAPAANAALGGANAVTTTLRPDIRSATWQSSNTAADTSTVRVCFDKALDTIPDRTQIFWGVYDAQNEDMAVSAVQSSTNCADVTFPNLDHTQYSYVRIQGSQGLPPEGLAAVRTLGFGNLEDSTALIQAGATQNGSRGFSSSPDLIGIQVLNNVISGGSPFAAIDYTFDQQVNALDSGFFATNDFVAFNQNGSRVSSIAQFFKPREIDSVTRQTVRVFFPAGSLDNVVAASVNDDTVRAKDVDNDFNRGTRTAARPGTNGFTNCPDLQSVTSNSDGSKVTWQYDQAIGGVPAAGDFHVVQSDSDQLAPTSVVISGNSVIGTMPASATLQNEYWVAGFVARGAVTSGCGFLSPEMGLPMGSNIGFSTGYTTGPEALTISFDNVTDTAHVLFDQRWSAANFGLFKLISAQGAQVSNGAINVSGTGATAAGKITADITFPAGTVSGARSLQMLTGALTTTNGDPSIAQVISPTAPASLKAKKFRKIGLTHRKASRRAVKRH